MIGSLLVIVICVVLILIALVGSLLPFIPGPPLGFLALLFYAYTTGFHVVTGKVLLFFAILTVLTLVLDFFGPALGASRTKASPGGMTGAVLGAFFGFFVAGPYGVIFGPLVGGFIGEYVSAYDSTRALQTAWGSFVGYMLSTIIRFAVALAMAVYFLFALLR
jgi:hypothetical protein